MTDITIIHVVASLHPRAGGPSRTVIQLTDALAVFPGLHITLMTQILKNQPTIASLTRGVIRRDLESPSLLSLRLGLPVLNELNRICARHENTLIHSHGVWLPVNHWASHAAKNFGIPIVIQPRGMLEPWALQHKAHKKRAAMACYQRKDLKAAQIIVATSNDECNNIRRLGFAQPIAVIPNGINLDLPLPHDEQPVLSERVRTVLFLSRVHEKKGLINLVHAWGQLRPAKWRLRIAGPDEGGHLKEVRAEARRVGVTDSIDYLGEVDGDEKSAVYRSADLFVLPTFSENFGVVVAEALAHGLPVITTRGAPWADLETYGSGWWIDIGVEPLLLALREAMALSDDERRSMGARGREYVRRYDWGGIAQQMIAVYRWVLGHTPQPECILMDRHLK